MRGLVNPSVTEQPLTTEPWFLYYIAWLSNTGNIFRLDIIHPPRFFVVYQLMVLKLHEIPADAGD